MRNPKSFIFIQKFHCLIKHECFIYGRFFVSTTFFLSIPRFTEAIRLHGNRLTEYELQEIEKYQEIWFLGLDACKINAKPGTALNSGYDDDNGSYNKVRKQFKSIDSCDFAFLNKLKKSDYYNFNVLFSPPSFSSLFCRSYTITYRIAMKFLK